MGTTRVFIGEKRDEPTGKREQQQNARPARPDGRFAV
jgi:hypothetical protein